MKKVFLAVVFSIAFFAGCSKDDSTTQPVTSMLSLSVNGLEDLGSNSVYEGWIMVNGTPKSSGTFTVNANGQLSKTTFEVNSDDLATAIAFILTIEPNPDPSPNPSDTHIIAGDFSGTTASLSAAHSAAFGSNFSSVAGKYILATPTNGAGTNENSGIWFLDLASGTPSVGLTLPVLPAGWKYEGWTVISGMPVSTGTFLSVDVVDDADPFSDVMPGPPFPGEDFLRNAPAGLTFPTDIAGGTAVISVEPSPDNSPNPFSIKPLVATIPANAVDHTTYMLGSNLSSLPTGSATK